VEICLLGSLEVFGDGGQLVAIPGHRVASLLTALALRCGEVVTDDYLIDALWSSMPPERSANALQRQVSRLRNALGDPALVSRRGSGYVLSVDRSSVDISRFDALVTSGHEAMRQGDPARARGLFEDALRLWRGDPLADVAYEEFAQPDIARLLEARLVAIEVRIDADLALGRDTALIGELEQLVVAHPLREHLRAQLMLALSRSGRQAEALRAYQSAREVLGEELGLEPSAELRALEAAILQQDHAVVGREGEATSGRPKTNLRTPLTTLIGRTLDMEALRPVVRAHRLVTLVGPGGVGKSRLAQELARERFADGDVEVWMVELALVTDGKDVLPAIMRSLELPRGGSEDADLPRLIEYLSRRNALLVLDNCEHLVTSAARATTDLLESCPNLVIWTTSREGLAVPGEVVWAVPTLALDASVALFLERGRAADPLSDITDASPRVRDALTEVCERLDGLPLAIELAAARLRGMPISELASGLEDRFRLLTRGARTAVPRQQTMRAVVDWSYDLLFDDERLVFDRLSVFRGSCSLVAARAVCADDDISGEDVTELIGRLVDKSLVVVEIDEFDGYGRCRMLQTLVDYGRDRLEESGDAARVYAAHVRYYADFARRSVASLLGVRQRGWLRAVRANLTNLRAALDVAVDDGDAETAYSIAGSLGWYWWFTGQSLEASQWLAAARSCTGRVREVTRARVWAWRVFADRPGLVRWGDAGGTRQTRDPTLDGCLTVEEMATLARESALLWAGTDEAGAELGGVEIALSVTFATHRNFDIAAELLTDAERLLARDGTDPAARAMRTFAAGRRAFLEGRYAEAEDAFRASVELFAELEIDVHCSDALRLAARLAAVRGDHATAVESLERAISISRGLSIGTTVNLLLNDLAESLSASGDFEGARAVLVEPLASARAVGFLRGICESLAGLAVAELRAAEPDRAVACAEEALEAALRIDHFEVATYCLVILGSAAGLRGDLGAARSHHVEALEVAQTAGLSRSSAFALENLAVVALREQDARAAARLLGAAATLREAPGAAVGLALAACARVDADPLLAAARQSLGDEAVSEAFAQGRRDPASATAGVAGTPS
jgi:predicted ATPase/DNA-binding SARP family transcriptional activator